MDIIYPENIPIEMGENKDSNERVANVAQPQRWSQSARKLIGSGAYGKVYRVKNTTGDYAALKEIILTKETGIPSSSLREMGLMIGLKTKNITKVLDYEVMTSHLRCYFELCEKDLRAFMENTKGPIERKLVTTFSYDLLQGIAECHAKHIIHRDLKPGNLLLTENLRLKITDFGLARTFEIPTSTQTDEVVTLWYRSPDIALGNKNYLCDVDIWSIGVIFIELFIGSAPFKKKDEANHVLDIFSKLGTPIGNNLQLYNKLPRWSEFKIELFPKYLMKKKLLAEKVKEDKLANDLLRGMLQYDWTMRPSAKTCLKHAYFDGQPHEAPTEAMELKGEEQNKSTEPTGKMSIDTHSELSTSSFFRVAERKVSNIV